MGSVALTPNRKELTTRDKAKELNTPKAHPSRTSFTPEESTDME